MTREERDKILKLLADERNNYTIDCERRIAEENGKVRGADYMVQRFLDIITVDKEGE